MNSSEIAKRIYRVLPKLKQTYGVRDLWLFGSYVHAKQTEKSDVDILVTFDNLSLSLIEFIQLEQELTAVLGVPVDLTERDMLKAEIGQHILREAVPL